MSNHKHSMHGKQQMGKEHQPMKHDMHVCGCAASMFVCEVEFVFAGGVPPGRQKSVAQNACILFLKLEGGF